MSITAIVLRTPYSVHQEPEAGQRADFSTPDEVMPLLNFFHVALTISQGILKAAFDDARKFGEGVLLIDFPAEPQSSHCTRLRDQGVAAIVDTIVLNDGPSPTRTSITS